MHQHVVSVADLAEPSEDAAYSGEPSLQLWQAVMQAAIAASRTAQALPALQGYQRALAIAHRLIEQPPHQRADDCVAALVVSYHNLADLHIERGEIESAISHLCAAHQTLIKLFLDPNRDKDMQQAALRHSRETYIALLSNISAHGPHPHLTHTLEITSRALDGGSSTRH
jgi:hypothetical protein